MPSRYNLNRWRKTYPSTRTAPVYINSDDVETAVLTFSNENSKTYGFLKNYSSAPVITATAASNQNVNVYITSVSTTNVTIKTSANITGDVHIHISVLD